MTKTIKISSSLLRAAAQFAEMPGIKEMGKLLQSSSMQDMERQMQGIAKSFEGFPRFEIIEDEPPKSEPRNKINVDSGTTSKIYEERRDSLDALSKSVDFNVLKIKYIFSQVRLTNEKLWNISYATFQRDTWRIYKKERGINKQPWRKNK